MSPRKTEARAMATACRTTPKAAPHRQNRDTQTLTVGTALDATTGDGEAPCSGSMREPTLFNHTRPRAAARAHARRREEYADVPLTTPMVEAAKCSCSSSMPRP
jgi:hypothetical protein